MPEIEGCPFCGGEAKAAEREHEDGWVDPLTGLNAYFSIICSNDDCPVEFNVFNAKTEEQAIEKWNKRIALNANS
jgi:hypothetical protein